MTEKKLTEAEIMKAMEDQKHLFLANDVFVRDALDLINRKNAKIEKGKWDFKSMQDCARYFENKYETARSEAIKEFAERMKALITEIEFVEDCDIAQIAKEMGVEL